MSSKYQLCIYLFTFCEIYQTEEKFLEHKSGIQKDGSVPNLLQLWNQIIVLTGKSHRLLVFIRPMVYYSFKFGRNKIY